MSFMLQTQYQMRDLIANWLSQEVHEGSSLRGGILFYFNWSVYIIIVDDGPGSYM